MITKTISFILSIIFITNINSYSLSIPDTLRIPIGKYGSIEKNQKDNNILIDKSIITYLKNIIALVQEIQVAIKKINYPYPVYLVGGAGTYGKKAEYDVDLAIPILTKNHEITDEKTIALLNTLNQSEYIENPEYRAIELWRFLFLNRTFYDRFDFFWEENRFVFRITSSDIEVFSKITFEKLNNQAVRDCIKYISDERLTDMLIAENISENFDLKIKQALYERLKALLYRTKYDFSYIEEDFETFGLLYLNFQEYFETHSYLNPMNVNTELTKDILVQIIRDLFDPMFKRKDLVVSNGVKDISTDL